MVLVLLYYYYSKKKARETKEKSTGKKIRKQKCGKKEAAKNTGENSGMRGTYFRKYGKPGKRARNPKFRSKGAFTPSVTSGSPIGDAQWHILYYYYITKCGGNDVTEEKTRENDSLPVAPPPQMVTCPCLYTTYGGLRLLNKAIHESLNIISSSLNILFCSHNISYCFHNKLLLILINYPPQQRLPNL